MKRKRSDDTTVTKIKERNFYNRDELLVLTTQLQLEYNRDFSIPRGDLSIFHYAATQNNLEVIAKINIILQACITEQIFKSFDEIKEIIQTTINVK